MGEFCSVYNCDIAQIPEVGAFAIEIVELIEFLYLGSSCIAMTDSALFWVRSYQEILTPAPLPPFRIFKKKGGAALFPHMMEHSQHGTGSSRKSVYYNDMSIAFTHIPAP
jgi:hypothetical protein